MNQFSYIDFKFEQGKQQLVFMVVFVHLASRAYPPQKVPLLGALTLKPLCFLPLSSIDVKI